MSKENQPSGDEDQTLDPDSESPTMPASPLDGPNPIGGDEPRQLAGYRLVRLLGRGGMGEVWQAQQERPNRRVAIKLVRGDLFSASMRRRFDIEAEALGRLSHEGIAKVFEAGLEPATGRPFYAMEYVAGQTLNQ